MPATFLGPVGSGVGGTPERMGRWRVGRFAAVTASRAHRTRMLGRRCCLGCGHSHRGSRL